MDATFFVATNGDDHWYGKLSEPNPEGTDGPFATLTQARDAVRQLRAKGGPAGPVTVMVRGGRYYLEETFVLTHTDSGTKDFPRTYTAYPGEKPVLSGGRKVTGWKPYKGQILQAALPPSTGRIWKFRQLFLNGIPQVRARWPKFEWGKPETGGRAFMEGPAEEGSHIAFKYKPGTFRHSWAKPREVEVNVFPHFPPDITWSNNIVPVASIDEEDRIVTLQRDTWHSGTMSTGQDFIRFGSVPFRPAGRFVVENVLEELEEPGEWALDSEEGVVYFLPPEELSDDSHVVAPLLDCLMDLRGVSHVTVSGFTFTETATGDNYHRFGLDGYGVMFPIRGWKYCGESLHMKDTSYCTVERNNFSALGGNAVYLESFNLRNRVRRNRFNDIGVNGVCLVGTRDSHPMFNQVTDNYFDRTGTLLIYTAAIFCGVSDGNLIAHNSISDVPHHAINLATNGYGRNIVEYNEIRRTCLIVQDNGAINSWMDMTGQTKSHVLRETERCGHVIRYNFIADTRNYDDVDEDGNITRDPGRRHTKGIFLDDYTSNCFVYGNIVVRAEDDAGIVVHGGKNNVIENNIFADCHAGPRLVNFIAKQPDSWQMKGFNTGNRFRCNIIYAAKDADKAYLLEVHDYNDRQIAESDNNLFFNTAGKYEIHDRDGRLSGVVSGPPLTADDPSRISLDEWRELGYEANSITADPMFVDPVKDDYRLRPDSPAFKLGFQEIDTKQIGVRDEDL